MPGARTQAVRGKGFQSRDRRWPKARVRWALVSCSGDAVTDMGSCSLRSVRVHGCARVCTRVCAHTRSQSFGEPEAERAGKGRQDRGTTMTNRRLPGRGRPSFCRPCGLCTSPDEGEGGVVASTACTRSPRADAAAGKSQAVRHRAEGWG